MNIENQKAVLTEQLENLISRIATNQEVVGQRGEGASDDDIASLYEMQAKAHSAIQIDKAQITRINNALNRIESGDYEYCSSCDIEINPKRLVANPVATLCIDCANREDHLKKQYM